MKARPTGPIWVDMIESLRDIPKEALEAMIAGAKARVAHLPQDVPVPGDPADIANYWLNQLTARDFAEVVGEAGYRPELRMH